MRKAQVEFGALCDRGLPYPHVFSTKHLNEISPPGEVTVVNHFFPDIPGMQAEKSGADINDLGTFLFENMVAAAFHVVGII